VQGQVLIFTHGQIVNYDETADRFVFEDALGVASFEIVQVEGMKLYPVGARSWIWEQV
jgi:hypothetical protein